MTTPAYSRGRCGACRSTAVSIRPRPLRLRRYCASAGCWPRPERPLLAVNPELAPLSDSVLEGPQGTSCRRRAGRKPEIGGRDETDADPSLGIRRKTPTPRSAVWSEGEAVRLVKGAWRAGYRGMSALLAIAWDTQLAPIDCRRLTRDQMAPSGAAFMLDRAKTGVAALGTLSKRTQHLLAAYSGGLGAEPLPATPLLRNRSGGAYTKETLKKDFAKVRAAVFGSAETRKIMDMRRSGAVEALAGDVEPGALAAKMANSIDQSHELQRTYLPVNAASVQSADDARRRGRNRLRGNKPETKVRTREET
jgi:hypothetical protein